MLSCQFGAWCGEPIPPLLLSHWHSLFLLQGTVCFIFTCKASGRGELLPPRDIKSEDTTSGCLWAPESWRLVKSFGEASWHVHPVAFRHLSLPSDNHKTLRQMSSLCDPAGPVVHPHLSWELLVGEQTPKQQHAKNQESLNMSYASFWIYFSNINLEQGIVFPTH